MANDTSYMIQLTANKLFSERGFADVTIDDICAGVGITKGTFYYHFKSKDDLLLNFFENAGRFSADGIMATLAISDGYWEKLWSSIQLAVDWATSSGKELLRSVLIFDLQRGMFSFYDQQGIVNLHTLLIKKGQEVGRFRNPNTPKELYDNTKTIFIGTLFKWCSSDVPDYDREYFKKTVASLLSVSDPTD